MLPQQLFDCIRRLANHDVSFLLLTLGKRLKDIIRRIDRRSWPSNTDAHAIKIAEHLGMPEYIRQTAQEYIGSEAVAIEELILSMENERH